MHAYFRILLIQTLPPALFDRQRSFTDLAMNTNDLRDKVRALFAALQSAHITRPPRNVSCLGLPRGGVASRSTSGASTPRKVAKHHHKTFPENENAPAP